MAEIETLSDRCRKTESETLISNDELFGDFDLQSGNPWEDVVSSNITTYYRCLYHIVKKEHPTKILEIGTAFGMSAATMLKASPGIDLFITVDLGIFGEQYGFSQNNIDYARTRIHSWCCHQGISLDRVRFYRANSQPPGIGDNDDIASDITRWYQVPDLVRLVTSHEFDVIFVDGKHTGNGLLNDLETVWPLLKDGGLIICDDLHDRDMYKDIFPWAGQTLDSFNTFRHNHAQEIDESFIWNYPCVIPADFTGLRPFGFIRKKDNTSSLPATTNGFEVFDTPEALEINRVRQDHLASLGLDLYHRHVLEVGAGIGRHTAFFEKMGCTIFSTDARQENVDEHIRRYPHRKGRVAIADLNEEGSHKQFGVFDVVYCYGTLYLLDNPAQCIRDLSENCSGVFLLETCVNPVDNGQVNAISENAGTKNQSVSGHGCRPARDWIMSELKKYYPYVYYAKYQPEYPDYPHMWPASVENINTTRAVFIGSKKPLMNNSLSLNLLQVQHSVEAIVSNEPAGRTSDGRTPELKDTIKRSRISIPFSVFHKKGDALFELYEYNIYCDNAPQLVDSIKKTGIFQPKTVNDHISLPYLTIANAGKNDRVNVRITMKFSPEQGSEDLFSFSLQDEKYRILYSCPPVRLSEMTDHALQRTILLKEPLEKLRILIRTVPDRRIPLPVSVKVEKMMEII